MARRGRESADGPGGGAAGGSGCVKGSLLDSGDTSGTTVSLRSLTHVVGSRNCVGVAGGDAAPPLIPWAEGWSFSTDAVRGGAPVGAARTRVACLFWRVSTSRVGGVN